MINPPLDKIAKDLPVCQYPRESYNRIAQIIGNLNVGRGLKLTRGDNDRWTLSIDEVWLAQYIEAQTSQAIDAAQNESEANGGGSSGMSGTVEVVTDVSFDDDYHKLVQSKRTLTIANGGTQSASNPTNSDITVAVPEMP